MSSIMTACAQRDQILLTVCSAFAAKSTVVDLQLLASATVLTPPTVALHHFGAQFGVKGLF